MLQKCGAGLLLFLTGLLQSLVGMMLLLLVSRLCLLLLVIDLLCLLCTLLLLPGAECPLGGEGLQAVSHCSSCIFWLR